MCIALVIGVIGNSSQPKEVGVVNNNGTNDTKVEIPAKVEKPATYTFEPGEVVVQNGKNTINYTYNPSANSQSTGTVAYEYIFGNTMDRATAVNLKEIDTTDVNVSYVWSTTRLDTTQSLTTYTNYELQRLTNYGDMVYIYVVVTPVNETIPVTFTSSIVWYYGIPYEMPIHNSITNEIEYQTIVTGQKIDKNTLEEPASFTKTEIGPIHDADGNYSHNGEVEVTYYFDGWFLDKDYTQMVEADDVRPGQKLYTRFHNIAFGIA